MKFYNGQHADGLFLDSALFKLMFNVHAFSQHSSQFAHGVVKERGKSGENLVLLALINIACMGNLHEKIENEKGGDQPSQ